MAFLEILLVTLRWLHIGTGSLALITSLVPLLSRKGSKLHNNSGHVFVLSILTSGFFGAVLGLVKSSDLLFFVGVLSCWSALVGKAALKGNGFLLQKRWVHGWLLATYLLTAASTLYWSWQRTNQLNLILCGFVLIALTTSVTEIRHLVNPANPADKRYRRHSGQIMGAVIACWTAFLVVNQTFSQPMLNWFLPTVSGGFLIVYWQRKIRNGWPANRKQPIA